MHFADRLTEEVKKKGTPICVGLDPRLEQIPEQIKSKWVAAEKNPWKAAAESILEFNKGIIDAVHDIVPVVKPQLAFYELYGAEGIAAFSETVKYAKEKGLLVIADAKRNDIGTTAEAYAKAFLGKVDVFGEGLASFDCDALTLNAYLGYDGVKPFMEQCRLHGRGVFVLVKTSNKSSGDFQDVVSKEDALSNYELMAHFVDSWGANDIGASGYSIVGAVVGATFPKQAARLRQMMPNSIFLVPGYGAQGAGADDVKPCFNKDGTGAIVNNSRGIIFSYQAMPQFSPRDYAQAARQATQAMKLDLQKVLS